MNYSFLDDNNFIDIDEITNDNFKEITQDVKYKYFVFDFYATWCGPCKIASEEFKLIAADYKDINFFKINIDDNDLVDDYEIQYLPTILVFKSDDFKNHIFKSESADLSLLKSVLNKIV